MAEQSDAIVYLVDDDEIVRRALSSLIGSVGLEVVACASAKEFFEAYDPGALACVVSDMIMPGMSGVVLQQAMAERDIDIPIIFMSGHADIFTVVQVMKAGAVDFLEKPVNGRLLLDGIGKALERCATRKQERQTIEEIRRLYSALSFREREIMRLVVSGQSNKDTAQQMGLTCKTIEGHRAKIYKKMHARSLADLIRMELLLADNKQQP